jgi:hypothetical protein
LPECPIFLLLYICQDLTFGYFIFPILRRLKTLVEMLLSMLLSVLSEVLALLLVDPKPELYVIY